jgi:hypothetical protein
MELRIIKLNCALELRGTAPDAGVSRFERFQRVLPRDSLLNPSWRTRGLRLANRAPLQAMNESFPQWPSLFRKFVLPSGPKHLLLNLWITDSQATNSDRNASNSSV